ncbi:MAG: Crp/Fnr family transcriptional regulator [Crocinitomicaceae bacterium]|nr:Crp/Fnr family transcriptional regulator [Crocinitomicaceae bacterium]
MKTIVEYLTSSFPEFSPELKEQIVKYGRIKHLEEGEELMSIGGEFKVIPLICEGAIKVVREDDEGNELFLYYLRPGQTCALSLNCFMMSKPSEVRAIADEETVLIALRGDHVNDWLAKYDEWRYFVMGTLQMRFHEMLHTIDGIAFKNLDERLLDFLKEKAEVLKVDEIHMTHQELADHLNSKREVISRILKILERKGQIQLGRNKIQLV